MGISWERGRPARMLFLMVVASAFAWRLGAGLPLEGGVIPAVRTGDVVYTLDREHGLHPAKQSGKKPGLKDHSPLEGESARPGRSPQSIRRWGRGARKAVPVIVRAGRPRSQDPRYEPGMSTTH